VWAMEACRQSYILSLRHYMEANVQLQALALFLSDKEPLAPLETEPHFFLLTCHVLKTEYSSKQLPGITTTNAGVYLRSHKIRKKAFRF
jgi:hypothetical protein